MKYRTIASALCLTVMSLITTQNPLKADIAYPDFMSDTVSFTQVGETSDIELFGAPTSDAGTDIVNLEANGFNAFAVGNGAVDVVTGRLSLNLQADDGFLIDSITVTESGSFFAAGDQSFASVSASASVTVGSDVSQGSFGVFQVGPALSSFPPITTGGYDESFTISDFDPSEIVRFELTNTLVASAFNSGANTASTAGIDKKGVVITVNTVSADAVAVPEPSSTVVSLMVLGLVSVRRRRSV